MTTEIKTTASVRNRRRARKLLAMLTGVIVLALTLSAPARGVYEGQIDGDFEGWEGETIYKLMDGHIIQQCDFRYHYHYAYSPHVIIYESNGQYKIHVLNDITNGQDVVICILR